MSIHNTKFTAQNEAAKKLHSFQERERQRSVNPFRLTDAGVRWLIVVPIIVFVLGVALILGELNYVLQQQYFDVQLPTI